MSMSPRRNKRRWKIGKDEAVSNSVNGRRRSIGRLKTASIGQKIQRVEGRTSSWMNCMLSSQTQGHFTQLTRRSFRQKFKSFVEQYELRELHFHALMRTKEGDVQLSLARAEEQRKRAETETTKARTLSTQVSTFSQTETELRSQLNIYVEKFKQVGLPPQYALVSSILYLCCLMFREI